MASLVSSNIYIDHHSSQSYRHPYPPPRPPPSPPMEDTRCSLPSISNLLDLADAGSPKATTATSTPRSSPREAYASPAGHHSRAKAAFAPHGSRHTQHKEALPPTPPQSMDMSFDNPRSPPRSTGRQYSVEGSQSRQYYSRTPPLEPEGSRRRAPSERIPYQMMVDPRQPRHDYHPSPLQHHQLPPSRRDIMYQDRAYPTNPYAEHPSQAPPPHGGSEHMAGSLGNVWEHHHHYLHPSQMPLFPQNQDRYICPTCHKAFSRPSSLRIHSHSHTGEKPFKCPHPGCGKAFSVRSNMKRHERGCHGMMEANPTQSGYTWTGGN